MKVNEHLSVTFWIRKSKMSSDGKAPLYCRITIDSKRTPFSTGKKIKPEYWFETFAKGPDGTDINKAMIRIRAELSKKYDQLEANNETVTAQMLKDAYLEKDGQNKTIVEAFEEYNTMQCKRVIANVPTLNYKTWQRFDIAKQKIVKFFKNEYGAVRKT